MSKIFPEPTALGFLLLSYHLISQKYFIHAHLISLLIKTKFRNIKGYFL